MLHPLKISCVARSASCRVCCAALRRTAPHRTAPHRTAPRRAAPHCTALHRTAPRRTVPHCTALHYAPGGLPYNRAIVPNLQPVVSQVTSLMIEPDYELKKVKGDSHRKSVVLAPEREVFSGRAEEDDEPSAQEQPDGWYLTSMTLDVGEDRKRKAAERVKRASVAPTSLFGCASSSSAPLAPPCAPLRPFTALYSPSKPLRPLTNPCAPLQAHGPGLRHARAGDRRGACCGAGPRGAGGGGGGAGEGARCGEGQV